MKQDKFIRKCGPYEVISVSQDMNGVRLLVFPAYPLYNLTEKEQDGVDKSWIDQPEWALHRYKGEGGGPGIFTAIALAEAFEKFLNQPYTEQQVIDWKNLNAKALKKVRNKANAEMNKMLR